MEGQSIEEKRQKEEEIQRKIESEKAKRIEEIKKEMPEWIEEGNSIIYKEKQEEWKKYVEGYNGESIIYAPIVKQALDIMKCLEETGSLIKAEEILKKQGHSGISQDEVIKIVFEFSKNGPDFYEDVMRYVEHRKIDEETAKKVSDKRTENNSYAHAERLRNSDFEISTTQIGKATINIPKKVKLAAQQIEDYEKNKDHEKEGEEIENDN